MAEPQFQLGVPGAGETTHSLHQRVIRAPVNPLDKSTVVSVFPVKIDEIKHTIQPGRFIIEPGTYEEPSLLVVGSSSWWKEMDQGMPSLEIPTGSPTIANSIINDYCNGLLACDMGGRMPGLFFVPGEYDVAGIFEHFPEELETAKTKQRGWYKALVEFADVLWAQSDGNPRSISDEMKLAAFDLNLKDKPWLKDQQMQQLDHCPVCGQLWNKIYPMCSHCRTIIDVEKYNALGVQQAPDVIPSPKEQLSPSEVTDLLKKVKQENANPS